MSTPETFKLQTAWGETIIITSSRGEAASLSRSQPLAVFYEPEIDALYSKQLKDPMPILRSICAAKRLLRGWVIREPENLDLAAKVSLPATRGRFRRPVAE